MAHATVTCLHLSVHSIAPPSLHQAGQPIFYAECLMHGAAHASQCAPLRPAPHRPAVNVDIGAPSIAPSAHATCAGACGEGDVADEGTNAAGGVAVADWLTATFGGGGVNTGGLGAHTSGVDG